VEFEPCCATTGQSVVAQHIIRNALEHPCKCRVVGRRKPPVVGAFKKSLSGEADAHQFLRRTAAASPHSAQRAVQLMKILTGLRCPGADAALGAPDLDRVEEGL